MARRVSGEAIEDAGHSAAQGAEIAREFDVRAWQPRLQWVQGNDTATIRQGGVRWVKLAEFGFGGSSPWL